MQEDASLALESCCGCVVDLLVEKAVFESELAKCSAWLDDQRSICERLQKDNDVLDGERLALEYDKFERDRENEELKYKLLEADETRKRQQEQHRLEQRQVETAEQETRIKYEKHFVTLSSEIETLQSQW